MGDFNPKDSTGASCLGFALSNGEGFYDGFYTILLISFLYPSLSHSIYVSLPDTMGDGSFEPGMN